MIILQLNDPKYNGLRYYNENICISGGLNYTEWINMHGGIIIRIGEVPPYTESVWKIKFENDEDAVAFKLKFGR